MTDAMADEGRAASNIEDDDRDVIDLLDGKLGV